MDGIVAVYAVLAGFVAFSRHCAAEKRRGA